MTKLFGYLFLFLSLLLSSCSGHNKQEKDTLQVLSLKGPSALVLTHMMETVPTLHAMKMDYQIYNEPNQIRAKILREQADVALVPTNMASILYNLGAPYRLAMVPVWGTLYICGTDEEVNALKDLRNKRVFSMARGMNPDIILRCLLTETGLDPNSDLRLDYSFPGHIDLANAVAAGRTSIAVLSEPQLSMVQKKHPDIRILIDLNQEWERVFGHGIPQTAVLVHNSLINSKPALYKSLIKEMKKSAHLAMSDSHLTAELATKMGILNDQETLRKAIPKCHINPVIGKDLREPVNAYLNVFYNFIPESIGGKLPDENFIVTK